MICLNTVTYRYSVNGNTTKPAKRGIRQGDHISPFLFVIIMEYLHRVLAQLHDQPDFNFHPKCEKLGIIDLSFADDLLLFARGDFTSIQLLLAKLKEFLDCTGLQVNKAKCKVYIGGITETEESMILRLSGFVKGSLPFKYLGIPLDCKRLTVEKCMPLIDRIVCKIKHWTARLLSYAGRLQLIKSVISGITAYWMH